MIDLFPLSRLKGICGWTVTDCGDIEHVDAHKDQVLNLQTYAFIDAKLLTMNENNDATRYRQQAG